MTLSTRRQLPPARLASWNLHFLDVSVAGDIMHANSSLWQRRHPILHGCRLSACYRGLLAVATAIPVAMATAMATAIANVLRCEIDSAKEACP